MRKTTLLLASVAMLSLTTPAFSADESVDAKTTIDHDAKGNVNDKSVVEKTDSAGTTTTEQKKVDVDVDSSGNTSKTVTTDETKDPKGLWNKTKTKTKDTVKTSKDGSVTTTHSKKVDGKTVEESTETK